MMKGGCLMTLYDEGWFSSAKESLWRAEQELCPRLGASPPPPPPGPFVGLDELTNAWEKCGHNLQAVMGSLKPPRVDDLLPTVFNLTHQAFLMLVDVRGFSVEDIGVDAVGTGVRVRVLHEERGASAVACRTIERVYELPFPFEARLMAAAIRDGTLYVHIPWSCAAPLGQTFF